MENSKLDQFEIEWQRSLKEPPLKQVEVKKIEVDLSLDTFLDRFTLFAEKSMQKGKIKKADYDELITQAENLKKVLKKINEKNLVAEEIAERAKKISKGIQDKVDSLKDEFKKYL